MENSIENHKVVSPEEWLVERKALLKKEKEITRASDEVARLRRALPWVKIEKKYVFEGPDGKKSLSDLFSGRSQLIVKHFMFGPGWEEGCVGCSFGSDHIGGALVHLENHDVSFAAISRAPWKEIANFKERMGWKFRWYSSYDTDFNYDFKVSFKDEDLAKGKVFYNYQEQDAGPEELPGISVFYKDSKGQVFHTYSCFARGDEKGATTYMFLDLTPKGRNENGPNFSLTDWVRHHDKY